MHVDAPHAIGMSAPGRPADGGKNAAATIKELLQAITWADYAARLLAADGTKEARYTATLKATQVTPAARLPIRTEELTAAARAHVGHSLVAFAAAAPVDELAEMRYSCSARSRRPRTTPKPRYQGRRRRATARTPLGGLQSLRPALRGRYKEAQQIQLALLG